MGELAPKTLWTPYTGLSNPVDYDGDGMMDVIVSLRQYSGRVLKEVDVIMLHLSESFK